MRRRLAIAVSLGAVGIAARTVSAAPETYRFDPVHTQVWFSADHQRFSHPLGRLRVSQGWFQFDEKDWSASRVDVTLDLASADMGDEKWSKMVRSGQFLDAERWPTARFTSRSVEKNGTSTGIIHGELTFRGQTRPVDVAFMLNRVGTDPYLFKGKAGFSATAVLDRTTFGITRYADVVGSRIDLRFEIEGIRDGDAIPLPPPDANDATQK